MAKKILKAKTKKDTKKTTPKKTAKVKKTATSLKEKKTKQTKTVKAEKVLKKRGRPRKSDKVIAKSGQEVYTPPPVIIPSKPAYSKDELNYFKKIILEKREEIIQQLESLRERMVDANTGIYVNENSPYSLHMAELGTDAMEKEKNYLFTQRETKFVGYLDEALKRIDNGTYGYCIDCGAVIPKGRLEAVPHSQHCLKCKTKFGK